jgi:hypothetical protein
MRYRVLALLLVVLVAGCTSTGSSPTTTAPTAEPTLTTTAITTTTTETPTTMADRVEMERGHPFGGNPVKIYVINESRYPMNTTGSVQAAISYWNEHSSEYGRYNATYELTSSQSDADIVIEFVQDVECGWLPDTRTENLGCAPLINPYERFEDYEHATISILAETSGRERVQVIKHEIGHTLGLTHGMEPMPLMSETVEE